MKYLYSILLSVVLAGCGTLDKSGVYAGDQTLYQADTTLATGYEVLHSFVLFESQNRASLAKTQEVTIFADKVRRGAPQWFASATALRDAYAGNPADATRSALQQSIDVIREATVQATKYLVPEIGK